jgi:hypothetical protein
MDKIQELIQQIKKLNRGQIKDNVDELKTTKQWAEYLCVKIKGKEFGDDKVSVFQFYDRLLLLSFEFYPIGRNLYDRYLNESKDFIKCDICGELYYWFDFWKYMEYNPRTSQMICMESCEPEKI